MIMMTKKIILSRMKMIKITIKTTTIAMIRMMKMTIRTGILAQMKEPEVI